MASRDNKNDVLKTINAMLYKDGKLTSIEVMTLEDFQKAVGGYLAGVPENYLPKTLRHLSVYCDEEGLGKYNKERAMWNIKGPMLFMGELTDDGEETSLTEKDQLAIRKALPNAK
jgi:hypothetical protein